MFLHDRFSYKSTDQSEDKAQYQKYGDRFAVDRTEKVVAILFGITAVDQVFTIRIRGDNDREIVRAYPQAEYTVTEYGLLKALILSGLRRSFMVTIFFDASGLLLLMYA